MNFIPSDSGCYNKLKEKFEFLFESQLLDEICQVGISRTFDPDEMLMDIGDT